MNERTPDRKEDRSAARAAGNAGTPEVVRLRSPASLERLRDRVDLAAAEANHDRDENLELFDRLRPMLKDDVDVSLIGPEIMEEEMELLRRKVIGLSDAVERYVNREAQQEAPPEGADDADNEVL